MRRSWPLLVLSTGSLLLVGCASSVETELRAERDRYALELADAQKAQRESSATLARLRSDLAAAQAQLGETQARLVEAEKQVQAGGAVLAEKDKQLAELASMKSQSEELRAEKASLERQLRDTEAKLADALARARAAETQVQALRGASTRPGATQPSMDMNK